MPPDLPALEAGAKRLDAELVDFVRWARPTAEEEGAMLRAVAALRRVLVALPGLRHARVFLAGSLQTKTMLPCSAGVDVRVVVRLDDHTAVVLSLAVARLLRAAAEWSDPGCDASARAPALWATHRRAGVLVRAAFVGGPPAGAEAMAWTHAERAVRRLVLARPPGVLAAALLLKALLAANVARGAAAALGSRGVVPGLAALLLAGCALAEERDAVLAQRPCSAALLLWDWFGALPAEGVVTADPERGCVCWRGTTCEAMRVVVRDPDDLATDLCAGASAEWWDVVRTTCLRGLGELGSLAHRQENGRAAEPQAILPGTLLHPAQWLAWQLEGRFATGGTAPP